MNKEIKKRKAISLDTKYEIIRKAEDGVKTGKLSEEYQLAKSTICTIISQKDKIIEEFEDNKTRERKRIKMSSYPLLEDAVKMWFDQNNQKTNVTISGNEIIEQAIKYAVFLGYTNFKESNGWLEKFLKRNNITLKYLL